MSRGRGLNSRSSLAPWASSSGAGKVWVNGSECTEAPVRHGDLCHAGTTWRFLTGPWVVARSAEMEASIAASPDDAARWQVYAQWLRSHGDPLGERMLQPRPQSAAEDARWIGHLGGELVSPPNAVQVEWFFGLPKKATLTSPFDVLPLIATEEARFLRHLVVDLAAWPNATFESARVFEALAASPRPTLLETLCVRLPAGAARPSREGVRGRDLFAELARKHPRLVTTWEALFEP